MATNSFSDYLSTRAGLRDLCLTYGEKKNMTVEEAIADFPSRCFTMGGIMIVAYDDGLLDEIYDMMYDR